MNGHRYGQIVVGTDGSSLAGPTVRRAAQIAVQEGATLHIVCAFTPITRRAEARSAASLGDSAIDQIPGREAAALALQEARKVAGDVGADLGPGHLVDGPAAAALIHVVRERSADLLVIGAIRDRSIADRLLGTVAEEVVRKASCDVLIVRPLDDGPVTGRPEEVDAL